MILWKKTLKRKANNVIIVQLGNSCIEQSEKFYYERVGIAYGKMWLSKIFRWERFRNRFCTQWDKKDFAI